MKRKHLCFQITALLLFVCGSVMAQESEQDKGFRSKAEFIEYAKQRLDDRGDQFFEEFFETLDADDDQRISDAEFANRMEILQQITQNQDSNADEKTDKDTKKKGLGKSDYERLARRAAPRDAFPVFDNPKMAAAADSKISDDEPVIGVSINGESKAYPISIMGRHELGNDVCGGTPITVSW